jgi:hypothetical protein
MMVPAAHKQRLVEKYLALQETIYKCKTATQQSEATVVRSINYVQNSKVCTRLEISNETVSMVVSTVVIACIDDEVCPSDQHVACHAITLVLCPSDNGSAFRPSIRYDG